MSEAPLPPPPRPILKLKVGSRIGSIAGLGGSSDAASPSAPSPTPTSTTTPKIKLKFGGGASAPKVTTLPDPPKPSPKIKLKTTKKPKPSIVITTKKRNHGQVSDPDDDDTAKSAPKTGPKKIKLTTSKTPHTPYLKIKNKGKPPPRPRGVAYDSEASDREDDPAIEEEFILRMVPGDDCDYLRNAIEEKKWGSRLQGGADIRLKFLQYDGRRATLTIRGRMYAASLVDMPCIVEGMKSWDRKSWYKAADICQMLLVLGVVKTEAEALAYPLPAREVDKDTWAYAHGLTPPMRWVRRRRFKQRVSTRTIEAVEEEVERLFQMDAEAAGPTKYELVNLDRLSQGASGGGDSAQPESEYDEGEVDADGEAVDGEGYFDAQADEEDEDALAAQFELAMQESDNNEEPETPAENPAMDTQMATDSEAPTPAAGTSSKEDSGDEESDDDEENDDEVDEDVLEQRAEYQRSKEEISDLEGAIEKQVAEMDRLGSDILKRKKAGLIQNLRSQLELKKAAIGEGEED